MFTQCLLCMYFVHCLSCESGQGSRFNRADVFLVHAVNDAFGVKHLAILTGLHTEWPIHPIYLWCDLITQILKCERFTVTIIKKFLIKKLSAQKFRFTMACLVAATNFNPSIISERKFSSHTDVIPLTIGDCRSKEVVDKFASCPVWQQSTNEHRPDQHRLRGDNRRTGEQTSPHQLECATYGF